jgi:hypothetical protein
VQSAWQCRRQFISKCKYSELFAPKLKELIKGNKIKINIKHVLRDNLYRYLMTILHLSPFSLEQIYKHMKLKFQKIDLETLFCFGTVFNRNKIIFTNHMKMFLLFFFSLINIFLNKTNYCLTCRHELMLPCFYFTNYRHSLNSV